MRYSRKIFYVMIIKVIAFLLIFWMLFQSATDLFRTKYFYYSVGPIYDLPKNTVDVLFLGTSHMKNTISPMDLWADYGITSFNAAIGQQTIPESYFELRELLKVQKPKVIIFEIYYILKKKMMIRDRDLHIWVDNIPFSLGVNEAIQTLIQEDDDKIGYYLNFFDFHNRWKELSEIDFEPSLGYSQFNQGAHATRGGEMYRYPLHYIEQYPTIVPSNEITIPPEIPLEYLYKIIELCREEEIPLIFIVQPCNIGSYSQRILNYVGHVAREEGVQYLNFFYLLDDVKFDFAKDMSEGNHVNYFGAKKITSYLGEYLQTNYQLEDHRDDPQIADLWNKDYQTFARELNNTMMKTAGNLDEYFNYLHNQDYILAWNAYSETPLSKTSLPKYLEAMGLDTSKIGGKKRYYAVTRGDRSLYQKSPGKKPNDTYMVEDTLFSFGSGITGSSNAIGVHVGRTECSVGTTGLNLVVYDPISRTVADKVNIDLDTGEIER